MVRVIDIEFRLFQRNTLSPMPVEPCINEALSEGGCLSLRAALIVALFETAESCARIGRGGMGVGKTPRRPPSPDDQGTKKPLPLERGGSGPNVIPEIDVFRRTRSRDAHRPKTPIRSAA
jgi:hypothetical protein